VPVAIPNRKCIVLEPLDTDAAHAILMPWLGDDHRSTRPKQELVRPLCGTPLFLEETARFLPRRASLSGTAEDHLSRSSLENKTVSSHPHRPASRAGQVPAADCKRRGKTSFP